MQYRFSVLIPVYNSAHFVRQTIESVLSQSFRDFEVLAVDDGSTDSSLEVLEAFGSQIRLIRQHNQGPEVARDNAAAAARGQYLVMLDHDDLLMPSALATYDRIIGAFDAPPLIIGRMRTFVGECPIPEDANDESLIRVLKYEDYLAKDTPLGHTNSQIVIQKSLFEEVGGYGDMGIIPAPDDVNLILKVGTRGPCIVVMEPCTIAYRKHPKQGIQNLDTMVSGILKLVSFEKEHKYPGGRKRSAARRAVIGGLAANYAIRYCWQGGERKSATRLILGTTPMILSALRKRLLRILHAPSRFFEISGH